MSDASSLHDRSVLVFGGGSGIGEAVARGFSAEGAHVIVVGRTVVLLENVADEIGGRAMTADVGDAESVAAVFSESGPVDVVVNAAAEQGGEGAIGDLWETEPLAFAAVVRVNLLGSYHVLRESIRSMEGPPIEGRAAKGGRGEGSVILFSGGGSVKPRARFGAYGASKSAVLRMVESTAAELRQRGSSIRVFGVAPGAVHTAMTEEVLQVGAAAGEEAVEEARAVSSGLGIPATKAYRLCRFLVGPHSAPLAGRLVHVNEDYQAYAKSDLSEDAGCLRRVGYD